MTAIDRRFQPDAERSAVYDRVFEAYVTLHPAIAPVIRRLAPGGAPVAAAFRAGAPA
jgi:hypothetical protein